MTQPLTDNSYLRNAGYLYGALLTLVAIIYAILSYFTPAQYDDLLFIGVYHDYSAGSDIFSLQPYLDYCRELREGDNSRIANLLAPFSTIFSPWCRIFPFLSGICVALTLHFTLLLGGIKPINRPRTAIILWMIMLLFLPWHNNLFIPDYALNYIWASAITLPWLYLFLSGSHILESNRIGVRIPLLVYAVIAGGWHEGFAFPTAGAILSCIILNRKGSNSRKPFAMLLFSLYCLSALLFALSPGMIGRFLRETGTAAHSVSPLKYIIDLLPVGILIGLTAYAFLRRNMIWESIRERIPLLVAVLLGAVLSIVMKHTPRTAFYPDLLAIALILALINPWLQKLLKRRLMKAATLCILLLCICQSTVTIHYQRLLCIENHKIMQMLIDSPDGKILYNPIPSSQIPLFTLYIPAKDTWRTSFQFYALDRYHPTPDNPDPDPGNPRHQILPQE